MLSKNTYRIASLAIFSAAALFISTSAASAATLTVINNSDSGAGSLRQAIIDSSSGDIINFAFALNGQTITLPSGELLNDKNLKIKGPGAKNLTISGNNAVRVFNVTTTGTVSFSGLTIANGWTDYGGGIYNASGTVNITNCTISNNRALEGGAEGGGIYGDTVIVTNSAVDDNFAGTDPPFFGGGGGIYGVTVTIHHSSVSGNYAYPGGCGGVCGATVTITNSEVNGNYADSAGGIYGATATVTNSTVSYNGTYDCAPGIDAYTATVTNSTVSNNYAVCLGGGINTNGAALTVTNSTVSGNSVTADLGGGISAGRFGTIISNITNSTVVSNYSGGGGGGIYNPNGALNITNSTVSGNYADNMVGPGGVGGGIYNAGTASVNIRSSIVALNTATSIGPDVAGSFTSSGFNLIGKIDGSMGFTAPTDLTGTVASPLDPQLDPNGLQNNGGPTQTIALLSGSPAIDKGASNGLTGHLTRTH